MKMKEISTLLLVVAALSLNGCGSETQQAYDDASSLEEVVQTETQEASTEPSEMPEASSDVETGEPTEVADSSSDSAPTTGSYEVDGISVTYYSTVHGDVTGNWRLAVIYDGTDLKDYVVDFYKEFVTDDSEVFGIVNLGLKTTARVDRVMSDTLDVTVMEYVDGEEHDAAALYTGMELERFWINTETGEVDPVDEDD